MDRTITYLRAPLFVWWDITYRCNLNCKQCYSNSGSYSTNELDTEEVKGITDQLKEMNVFYIYFLGGEPFIRKDFLEIIRYCDKVGITVMINTNGWFINEKIIKEIKNANVAYIRVSIDGANAQTHDMIRGVKGSFDRAVYAIDLLKKHEIPIVGISPTAMQENFNEIESIIDLAFKHKVFEIQVVQLCSTGRGKQANPLSIEQLDQLKSILSRKKKEYVGNFRVEATPGLLREESLVSWQANPNQHIPMFGCQAGRSALNIGADGLVMYCLLHREVAGDLRKQSLKQIWEESPLFIKKRTIKDDCLGCQYQNICSQECPLEETPNWIRKSYLSLTKEEKICQEVVN
ncbi:MAG: radical SAM protein [bacterium]